MLKLSISIIISYLLIPAAWACDEQCQRQQAEAAGNKFPSYLSWSYCEDLKLDFMTREVKSLQKYREQQLPALHPGGMNNTRKFLKQRQEWLQECESYITQTGHGHLFENATTTTAIFSSIDAVQRELSSLVGGVTYGQNRATVAGDKFDQFFKLIDTHQTHMLLKGQVVYR